VRNELKRFRCKQRSVVQRTVKPKQNLMPCLHTQVKDVGFREKAYPVEFDLKRRDGTEPATNFGKRDIDGKGERAGRKKGNVRVGMVVAGYHLAQFGKK
jgi:hypothetical protein